MMHGRGGDKSPPLPTAANYQDILEVYIVLDFLDFDRLVELQSTGNG